jgi:hypothetical protein
MIVQYKDDNTFEIRTEKDSYKCMTVRNDFVYEIYNSDNNFIGLAKYLANVQAFISNYEDK